MGKTYTVSEMRLIERVAAAMYETPDPTEPDFEPSKWPPTHREDRAWWMAHATAAFNAVQQERQNRFIAESSAAYPDVEPDEAARILDELRNKES